MMIKLFHSAVFPILMSTVLTACGSDIPNQLTGQAVDAQVLNADTKQPIEGAIVLLTWSSMPKRSIWGFDGSSQGHDICYHAETAVSDAQGRYHTDAWSRMPPFPKMPNGEFVAIAYKRGYVQTGMAGSLVFRHDDGTPDKRLSPTIFMKHFTGTLDKRFEDLRTMQQPCHNVEPSAEKNLYPMAKAIYDEMEQTAETKQQREVTIPNFKSGLDALPSR